MADPKLRAYSRLVEQIYDCAIEPDVWPQTMAAICAEHGFVASTILLADFQTREQWHLYDWNSSPHFQRLIRDKFAADSAAMFEHAISVQPSLDEPLTLSRGPFDMATFHRSPLYLEWAKPQGYGDAINVVVLHEPRKRIGTLAVVQRECDGSVTDDQIEAMRLLAPHLRRAVTIGDLIDLRLSETQSLKETLDCLAVGVVLVDERGLILHANRSASTMIESGGPITSHQGRIGAATRAASDELRRAMDRACRRENGVASAGLGILLGDHPQTPATIHVLPLAHGAVRSTICTGAAVAVFVTLPSPVDADRVEAVAQVYGLTAAEGTLLEHLLMGRSLAEAAVQLGIATTTVKTQLAGIFAKTGVGRQSDLIRLSMALLPPLRPRN